MKFGSIYVGRFRYVPSSRSPSGQSRVASQPNFPPHPVVHTDSASYTPLAQYFTFTGRLNPVRESRVVTTKEATELANNDMMNKFESVAYKLKLHQESESNNDANKEEHSKDNGFEGEEDKLPNLQILKYIVFGE